MSETSNTGGSHLTRLPFNSGDGVKHYCVEGVMTADPNADGIYAVATPNGQISPGYCVDCMGELGAAELVYGIGAEKCMRCGSVFLRHQAA
jgi:hypothetical protein